MEGLTHEIDDMSVGDLECAWTSSHINLDFDPTEATGFATFDENLSNSCSPVVLPLTIQHDLSLTYQDDFPYGDFIEDAYLANSDDKEPEHNIDHSAGLRSTPGDNFVSCSTVDYQPSTEHWCVSATNDGRNSKDLTKAQY